MAAVDGHDFEVEDLGRREFVPGELGTQADAVGVRVDQGRGED